MAAKFFERKFFAKKEKSICPGKIPFLSDGVIFDKKNCQPIFLFVIRVEKILCNYKRPLHKWHPQK